ncbi:MAG: nucleotidyltransferase domain-containing protein [Anaerotignum sp.]|nr:nucleotidyltransferase domain-containing protein [Anaerotignum sp.]MBQ7102471.1 nucleotidyltransferase domain-containing protein [Anaerotignum sp.]
MTKEKIIEIVNAYVSDAYKIYGSKLKSVILFGSCARGDFDDESDIDLMVLLDVPPQQIPSERRKMRKTADRLDLEYDCVISAAFQSYDEFETYREASMFYTNVMKEGLKVG